MSSFWIPLNVLVWRELVRFYRQRARVVGALGTPILFWLFLGSGLGHAFRSGSGEGGYLEYFFPGAIALTVLFTSIFSTISVIEDRREGFLQSVLVAPISRVVVVLGKVVGGSLLALSQGVLFLCLAPLLGISLSFEGVLWSLGAMGLMSLALTALGFAFAWRLDSVQGFHGVMNLILMPMWLLSGALFPFAEAPLWLRVLMRLNPLSYGVELLRGALYPGTAGVEFGRGLSVGVLVLFSILFIGVSTRWVLAGAKSE